MTAKQPIRLAAFTGGENDPSARLRVRQHIDRLRKYGIEATEYYPYTGSAHRPATGSRVPWLLSQLKQRYRQIRTARAYSVALLQRQLITTINTFEFMIAGPRILDVDDAIWVTCRFGSADRLARQCETVICGNDFIAEHFSRVNSSVRIIPTTVDTAVWVPADAARTSGPPIIGWIGTRGNQKYLHPIEWALAKTLDEHRDARLLIVSDAPPEFSQLPASRVDFRHWSAETEVSDVQDMSIGIMPLADTLWERGKCSCKLLQYLACGIPAVASPVGTNVQIAARGGVLLADTPGQWTESLLHLLRDETARTELGNAGRVITTAQYSAETSATLLAKAVQDCL